MECRCFLFHSNPSQKSLRVDRYELVSTQAPPLKFVWPCVMSITRSDEITSPPDHTNNSYSKLGYQAKSFFKSKQDYELIDQKITKPHQPQYSPVFWKSRNLN